MRPAASIVILGIFAGSVVAAVDIYPVTAAADDAPYAVQVQGRPLPLERVGEHETIYYGRFACDGDTKIDIQVKPAGKLEAEVRPDRYAGRHTITDNALAIDASGPGPRMVFFTVDGESLPPLFVLVEPPEEHAPRPDGAGVLNVADHGVTPGDAPQTASLQKVLDACAARPDGGTVYVPAGLYRTGTLRVGSNTRLYLAAGATLKALDDPAAFPVDGGRKEHGDSGSTHSNSRLLMFDRARNSALFGRGTLDANGLVLRNQHNRRVQVIDVTDSEDIEIRGVTLRNTASWTLHILHCSRVVVGDLAIITDWSVANSDGIDPDASQDVIIERVFFYTSDDAVAVKTTANSNLLQPVRNVAVRDCVVMTRKTSLKVGTETRADISNVLFENIDIVRSSRAIGLWARDGGTISNILWRDIRMDLREIPREGRSGQPIYIMAKTRHGASKVEKVLIEDLTIRAPWYCLFETNTPWPLSGVWLRDIEWVVTPRTDKQDAKYLFEFDHVAGIIVENLRVDWSEADAEHWKGLWADDAPVKVRNVGQTGLND